MEANGGDVPKPLPPPPPRQPPLNDMTVGELLGPLDGSQYDLRPHPDLVSPQVPLLPSGLPLIVPPINVKRVQNDPQNIFLRTIYKTLRKQAEAAAALRKRKVSVTPGGKITGTHCRRRHRRLLRCGMDDHAGAQDADIARAQI